MSRKKEVIDLAKQPISNVRWVDRDELVPNGYNPNKVAPDELELLIVSILEDGYTQPIVALSDRVRGSVSRIRWTRG